MILGIDIGGTTSKLGLVKNGQMVARARIGTTGHANEEAFADALANAARELATSAGGSIERIGVGAPNGNQHTGTIAMAPNLPWKCDVPLAAMLTERLGAPCILGNDANAAALGEWRFGAGVGFTDLLVVTIGTGLGSGFIVDGKLLLGPFGNAGELGHVILVPDGRPCTCGRNGCLEAYVSIRGMRETYAVEAQGTRLLHEEGVLPIAQAARDGDPGALRTFDLTARWLAIGLANAVALIPTQRIVLFGGVARNGELLLGPVRKHFGSSLLNIHAGRVEIVASALPEDDAAILGAAALGAS
jgi:glucokinase